MNPFDPALVTAVVGIISGVILVVVTYAYFSPLELYEASQRRSKPRREPSHPGGQMLREQPVVVVAERRHG